MHMLLITLVGPRRSVDLQVPGEIPLSELIPTFLQICGPSPLNDRLANPACWSVSHAGHAMLLDQDQSLLSSGIINGMTLTLLEKSSQASEQQRKHTPSRGLLRFAQQAATTHATPTAPFHVPVRDYPPRLPNEEIAINAPPQLPGAQGATAVVLQLLLPLVGCLGGSLFFLTFFMNGAVANARWMIVIAIAVPLLSIGASLGTNLVQRWMAKKQQKSARETYLQYLTAWRTHLEEIARQRQQLSARLYPALPTLAKNVVDRRYLWERRPRDYDFLYVSVGQGPAPLCNHISLGLSPDPMIKYEPELRTKVESLIAQYHHLDDEPAVIPLRDMGVLAITGKRSVTLPLVRAMLCQVVAFHTPKDVRCVALFPQNAAPEWSWLKWLPHAQRLRYTRETKQQIGDPLCLLADTPMGCRELLTIQIKPELELRRKLSEDQHADGSKLMLPHLVFVIDGFTPGGELAQLPELDELFRDAVKLGVTILCIVDEAGWEPTGTHARIMASDDTWLTFEVTSFEGRRLKGIVPNAASLQTCEVIARSQALITPTGDGADEDIAQDVRLLDLLHIPAAETLQSAKTWVARERDTILRVPLGKREKGSTLLLDLKEAADKGDGPHGLVVGATGSGKSELLRTLVISQAVLHDPDTVNFVFVDFKGGASFADLTALPHVAGMITNLEHEPALVDRMHASLLGELRRRQRMLREAGNLDNIQQYRAMRQKKLTAMEPMPHLLLIVDEFAELLANRSDFLDLFVTIGRIGRSLGLHLLLATQRLEEGRLKGLESFLRYRFCLRTFSAAESAAVLGKPDAYFLPSAPGIGYLKIDANAPLRFKAALISTPYIPANKQVFAADQIHEFSATGRLLPRLAITQKVSTNLSGTDQTEMDVVIERLAEPSRNHASVHQVWLPPLPKSLKLEELIHRNFDGSFWHQAPPFSTLCVPVGLLDVPLEQKQMPLLLDFSGAGGHLAVVGAPQSGKSTLLRTLMTAFIVTHSPRDVQLYCIDLGGGQLRTFEAFPHVGAVCTKTDRERIRLLIRLMYKIIADREALFRDHNIESMATFRMRRHSGEFSTFPFGDVFLLIDNLAQLQHDFEQIEAELMNLVTIGLTYGVHIVLATNRAPEIRPKLRDNIGTRLELRLNDPLESDVDKKKAAELPLGVPGRGLIKDKLQFQTCLPWISTDDVQHARSERSQQQPLEDLVERTKVWKGPVASPVIMLPARIAREEMAQSGQPGHAGVPIGLEEFRLEPAYIDLFSMGPHFLILGDSECGKTNLLRLWWSELVQRYTPEQVRVAAIECRSTINLFDITQSEHCLTYASMRMPSSLKESVDCLANTLKERALPTSYSSIRDLARANPWTGPHYFLFVDDYDAIATPSGSALTPLRDLILQARDIGFHFVLTRTINGAGSMSYEPIFKSLREMGGPGLIMSGDRQEGKLLHDQVATNLPPGRGYLVQRKYPATQVQVALA